MSLPVEHELGVSDSSRPGRHDIRAPEQGVAAARNENRKVADPKRGEPTTPFFIDLCDDVASL